MEFDKLTDDFVEALTSKLDVVNERQIRQRERYFERDDDGTYVEICDNYRIAGQDFDWPRSGMETPTRLAIKRIRSKVNTDAAIEKRNGLQKLLCKAFGNSADQSSVIEFDIELTEAPASRGMMALHRNAGNRIATDLQHLDSEIEASINPEQPERAEGE